jgi:hypothetical protein
MMNKNGAWGIGFVIWGIAAACAPANRVLGDEPTPGAGGEAKGGSGSVLPMAGSPSTPTPSAGGAPDNVAGAASGSEPCFSPSQNLELTQTDPARGCRCNAIEPVCVSDLAADPPWYGMLVCDGHWRSIGSTCEHDCFSPTSSPGLALVDPTAGCACKDAPPECVETNDDGQPRRLSLSCEDGRWTSVEDGACGSGRQTDCRVDGVTHPHGARGVKSPFSICNTCDCSNGELVNCTMRRCADTVCEQGSYRATRCAACGPVDECLVLETGCLSGEGCEDGSCVSPWCL